MSKPSEGKLLYHITHINNMPSILANGLVPRCQLDQSDSLYEDIADQEIIAGRAHYKVDLSSYVPFHFYAKNPFDGAVCKDYGSNNMVIITIRRDLHKRNDFLIIPTHPLDRNDPEIFPYEEGFNKIRWDILDGDCRDYHDPDIKKACMAECDVKYTIPPQAFYCVFLYNQNAYDKIMKISGANVIKDKLKINPNMFPKYYK